MSVLLRRFKENVVMTITMILVSLVFGAQIVEIANRNSIPEYFMETKRKIDVVYLYSTEEMVRFVEKQYTKVTEKPDDFYPTDLQYCIDIVWPNIEDSRKTASLISKYNYLLNYYETNATVKLG